MVLQEDTFACTMHILPAFVSGTRTTMFVKDLDTDTRGDSLRSGGLRILKRLRDAFIRRADEVDRIVAHMAESPTPSSSAAT